MFISFTASALRFTYCRPVLGLDGTHLKHRYQCLNIYSLIRILGTPLAAAVIDANGQLFLTHVVVDVENDDNWLWFLKLLLTIVQFHAHQFLIDKALVLLSDRQKDLLEEC